MKLLQAPDSGLTAFRKEMDRFFDRVWAGDELPVGTWVPEVDISETAEAVTLKAEVPGIEPKDLQVTLEDGVLTLRGEKRQVEEQKDERRYRSERRYGNFVRGIRLPASVEPAKVAATFRNGVVTVVMPKSVEKRGKTIPISTE